MQLHVLSDQEYYSLHSKFPVFASREFLICRSDDYGWIGNDKFVLPYIIDKRLIFSRLIFTNACIPIADIQDGDEQAFLDAIPAFVKSNIKVDFIAKSQAQAVFNTYPKDSIEAEWGTFIIDLSQSEDDIFSNFQARYRSKIRSAGRKGAIVERTDDVDAIHELVHDTFRRQGEFLFPSKELLNNMKQNLGDGCLFYRILHEGEMQGCIVIAQNKLGAHYYYGGSIPKPLNGALNLLHWEAMKDLKAMGVEFYDFMGARIHVEPGSKIEGIQTFKSRFGAELQKGYSFKCIFKPLKYKLFMLLVQAYYRYHGSKFEGDPIDQIRDYAAKVS